MNILRDNSVAMKSLNGLILGTVNVTSTSGGTVTIETHCTAVVFEIGKLDDATACLAATTGNSSTYSGTKTLAYSVAAGKTLKAIWAGSNGYTDTSTVSTNATIDSIEVY